MSTEEIQKIQQAELHATLWDMANDLRGTMEAYEFKSYILGLIFFRYLSQKVEKCAENLLKDDDIDYKTAYKDEEYKEALEEEITEILGYYITPTNLFSNLIELIRDDDFDIEALQKAISQLVESSLGEDSQEVFSNLFDDMDLSSSKLGRDVKSRSKVLSKVLVSINRISFEVEDSEIDVLGDAYEYLIGMFAQTAGKKAGEFYTPQQVSKILAKIVTLNKTELKSVYDPCCGSGSLLLRVGKETKVTHFYGEELTSTTYNLARMNMLLHDVAYPYFHIHNTDTLETPTFVGEEFSAVVANPPYSAKWSANPLFLDDDRFSGFSKLAPTSKADFAFVQHMLYHLDSNGTMAVVLPHGVLFRGSAEETIRTTLIKERNYLDCVIGLPANLFFGTSIPTCVLVFKKERNGNSDHVLFIDASNDFTKAKNQNLLTDENIDKIIDTYKNRTEIEKYSHKATLQEVEENEYNLNIPRYVDTFEEEEQVDINDCFDNIKSLKTQSAKLDKKLQSFFDELGL